MIKRIAKEQHVPEALVRAVIDAESSCNPEAISRAGAVGLMQLMPKTQEIYGVREATDPEQNIRGGTRHLKYLREKFPNNLEHVVAAYNAGDGKVARLKRVPRIPETELFVEKVVRGYREYLKEEEAERLKSKAPSVVALRRS